MENSELIQPLLEWNEFLRVELRVGTVLSAEPFTEARKPAYKLLIDFGPFGIKKSSAQITSLYTPEELPGRQVVAVINFPSKRIAGFLSECLVLGALGPGGEVTLIHPGIKVENGARIA